jgi:hypothetical protein
MSGVGRWDRTKGVVERVRDATFEGWLVLDLVSGFEDVAGGSGKMGEKAGMGTGNDD